MMADASMLIKKQQIASLLQQTHKIAFIHQFITLYSASEKSFDLIIRVWVYGTMNCMYDSSFITSYVGARHTQLGLIALRAPIHMNEE